MASNLVSKHFNTSLPLNRFPATLGLRGDPSQTLQPDQSPKVNLMLMMRRGANGVTILGERNGESPWRPCPFILMSIVAAISESQIPFVASASRRVASGDLPNLHSCRPVPGERTFPHKGDANCPIPCPSDYGSGRNPSACPEQLPISNSSFFPLFSVSSVVKLCFS